MVDSYRWSKLSTQRGILLLTGSGDGRSSFPVWKTSQASSQVAAIGGVYLQASLVTLQKLHPWGFVHLDLKANNICVPVQERGDESFRLKFDEIRFIDLTFSRHDDIPFENTLPLEPQSPLPVTRDAARLEEQGAARS